MLDSPVSTGPSARDDASADAIGAAAPTSPAGWRWINRYAALGPTYSTSVRAQPMRPAHRVAHSADCAALIGLPADWLEDGSYAAVDVCSGNALWPGMRPVATVYSGHQFGVWAGQLGDGRALLLGEAETPTGRFEIQLKGAGRTPYSRGGDGRAVLRSSIREFLCSEAMHALGIPTTRALCLTGSTLPVRREALETAAVVTRVAPSFLRFGHFEHYAQHDPVEALRRLAEVLIAHHYPACADAPRPVAALLAEVTRRTATLMAHWQAVGFCHGVMNTDNMSMLGLTIDYGPFGFLDGYDPGHICNHSDHGGRYAYARQPQVAHWNLYALAQALLPLLGEGEAAGELALEALALYKPAFEAAYAQRYADKLGLLTVQPGDAALRDDLLALMAASRSDYTVTFRRLSALRSARYTGAADARTEPTRDLFLDRAAFDSWAARYAARLRDESSDDTERAWRMNRVNPAIVLRNHLAEVAIKAAENGDCGEVQRLHEALRDPYDEVHAGTAYAALPPAWAQTLEVSCSS